VFHLLFVALLTPSDVIAKARAAAGSVEPGTYRLEERETLNDDTISYVRIEQGPNYVLTVRDGDFTTAQGRFDGVDWSQNSNGIVFTRSRTSIVQDPFLEALRAPDVASSALRVENDADGNIELDVSPRTGMSERRTYDPKTFLLARIDYDDPRGRASFIFSAYKRYFGEMIATHVQYTSEFANNNATYDVVSFDRVPDGSVNLAIPASRPVFNLGSRTSLLIPTDFTTDGIVVRVTIAGRGLDFILDSGASESVIDLGVARQLGLKVYDQRTLSFLGTTSEGHAVIDDLALGDLHAPHFAISVIPLSHEVEDLGIPDKQVVGLLGGDFFASGRIAIDFGKQTVTMLAPTAPLPTDGWSKLPIEVTTFVPRTTAKFNGVKGTFLLDTGSWSTILFPHYFANFTPKGKAVVQGQTEGIAGKMHDFRTYTFSRIDIGDMAFADIVVQVMDGGNAVEDVGADGLLGRTFLDNFSLIFDYADQTLYMKPEIQ
jgi:hypothetical protein